MSVMDDLDVFRVAIGLYKKVEPMVPKNRATDRVDITDVMAWLDGQPDEFKFTMKLAGENMAKKSFMSERELDAYDYSQLGGNRVQQGTMWGLQILPHSIVSPNGKLISKRSKDASLPGALPGFRLQCYNNEPTFRYVEDTVGPPDSNTVLRVFQRAIVTPFEPSKPALPAVFELCAELSQHADTLRPFLDSLPAPFRWEIESAEEAQEAMKDTFALGSEITSSHIQSAEQYKGEGNQAYAQKRRSQAVEKYAAAAECIRIALSRDPEEDVKFKAKKLLAIVHSNRAAALLLPGAGQEPIEAFGWAVTASHFDPTYAKAVARQVQACRAAGTEGHDMAKEVLATALHRDEMKDHPDLTEMLIMLYTEDKGLSDDEATFKGWHASLRNEEKYQERLGGLEGLWKKRIDDQSAKFEN